MSTVVVLDGVVVAPADAKISVFDRGFLFGDSVFETIRTYDGKPFALQEHLARLNLRFQIGEILIAKNRLSAESVLTVLARQGKRILMFTVKRPRPIAYALAIPTLRR